MASTLKAYEVSVTGWLEATCYYAAHTCGRARYLAALSLHDAGYARSVGAALRMLRCIRAPEQDMRAVGAQEGCINL
jgi:hypothetical protein